MLIFPHLAFQIITAAIKTNQIQQPSTERKLLGKSQIEVAETDVIMCEEEEEEEDFDDDDDDDDDDDVCVDSKSQVQVWVVYYESLQSWLVFRVKKPTGEIYGRVLEGLEKDATVNSISQRGRASSANI